ncbi:MAG: DNA alkylation repair protein [Bacteroidota bacterium]
MHGKNFQSKQTIIQPEVFVKEIRRQLRALADPQIARRIRRYFKATVRAYGLRARDVHKLSREYVKKLGKSPDLNSLIKIVEQLFSSANMEEGAIAIEMLRGFHYQYTPQFFRFLDKLVDKLTNWAHVDALSLHHISRAIEDDPTVIGSILKWTDSRNPWRRRAAAISLIPLARCGQHIDAVLSVAEKLITDKEELVQKSVSRLLKEAMVHHPRAVGEFLLAHRDHLPHLMLKLMATFSSNRSGDRIR